MNFLTVEKRRQLQWKLTTKSLPREARAPGLYYARMFPFCLPMEYAGFNLFQGIRDEALALFERLSIVWHTSALPGLPSNHLCSSQVFCVNALTPFMHLPEALAELLRPFFPDLARVIPIEEDRFIAYEFIDPDNLLGEIPKFGTMRRRGAGNTSLDAAILYEAQGGERVLLLLEWKYSESYPSVYKRFRTDGTDRVEPYRHLFHGPFSPFNLEMAGQIEDYMYEPFYQAMRQQLLASQYREFGIPCVDQVRLVHVAVAENRALRAVTSPRLRELGDDFYRVWRKLLVNPDDFVLIATEDLFRAFPIDRFPDLEPWLHYMKSRYAFLR
ncbi:MAG: hypothetical protein WCL50_14905 [Spirochaetota bacterium]